MSTRQRFHLGECRQSADVYRTTAEIEAFRNRSFRWLKSVTRLSTARDSKIGFRELKLANVLVTLAWRANMFRLCLRTSDLQTVSGLDDEYLPKARTNLERAGVLLSQRQGRGKWHYTLTDPKTGEPFAEGPEENPRISVADSWGLDAFADD